MAGGNTPERKNRRLGRRYDIRWGWKGTVGNTGRPIKPILASRSVSEARRFANKRRDREVAKRAAGEINQLG